MMRFLFLSLGLVYLATTSPVHARQPELAEDIVQLKPNQKARKERHAAIRKQRRRRSEFKRTFRKFRRLFRKEQDPNKQAEIAQEAQTLLNRHFDAEKAFLDSRIEQAAARIEELKGLQLKLEERRKKKLSEVKKLLGR